MKPKHTRKPQPFDPGAFKTAFVDLAVPPAPEPDDLDKAVASAIATVQADLAVKQTVLVSVPADDYAEQNPHGEALQPGDPKKRAAKKAKALKAAQASKAPKVTIDSSNNTPESIAAGQLNVSVEITPHLDPESGLWIPKTPPEVLAAREQAKLAEKAAAKAPKPPKPLKEVVGQPSRGPNSTTAVVSMKVALKTTLAHAATRNLRSLSAQAALYILEGLKRDGFIQDHPAVTAQAAE